MNPGPGLSYRVALQERIGQFLELDPATTSVICVSSGTNALRAVLRGLCAADQAGHGHRDEVIVPQTTVGATVEAVIAEGFKPVFVAIDPASWLLSLEATGCAISDKTAAIIPVDWLGTQCDLGPLRALADKHSIKLISDSAQSFGASHGEPPSVSLAHATIYSLGYPKVLTGAGSGGLIVCPTSLDDVLEKDATGILRHEALAEVNAFACLRALESFPEALEARNAAGRLYRQLLGDVPGIIFQQVPTTGGTNHYQISFTVDAEAFGLSAKQLCKALKADNVYCSADRMPCVAANAKFARHGTVAVSLEHSQLLATTSVTLPISNTISLGTVETICGLVKLIYQSAQDIVEEKQTLERGLTVGSKSADVIDLESKFHQHLVVPVLDNCSVHSKILVSHSSLRKSNISIDELLERFTSRQQWSLGERVLAELRVDAIIGSVVILTEHGAGQSFSFGSPVVLDESGSSASVTLVPQPDGKVTVHKSAAGFGIDGNGAPWLRRQALFLNASHAVKKTGMFVVPTSYVDTGVDVKLVLPYIASHSLAELVFANAGAESIVDTLVDMLALMTTSVWTENQKAEGGSDFIHKAHFERMRRRLEIARAEDKALDKILDQKTVMLNGRRLDGFETVMEKLERHAVLSEIEPTILSEIHGDLNIHNVLSRLDPDDDECLALIDPRGVPLLGDDIGEIFERGDYCYDVSKLLFSLTGFSEIRKRLFAYSADGDSHMVKIRQHPGSETMNGAAEMLMPKLKANKIMRQWIDKVEQRGARSFELRVRIGEAANFVADCACAIGRDTPWEIVPMFLVGLEKLNDVVNLFDGKSQQLFTDNLDPPSSARSVPPTADLGVNIIQHTLFEPQPSIQPWPFDLLEISIKHESASTLQQLLLELVGTHLPPGTAVHLSTDPAESTLPSSPCTVLIHPSNSVRGQTHMLAAATRRTTAFLRDHGVSQRAIDGLRVVHLSSTGASSRSQFCARANDKLLSPGVFGIAPLQLALLQATQLPFPRPGRWVLENDSFFLLSRPLAFSGDGLCLLAIERPTSGSSSSWRVCVDGVEEKDGKLLVKGFRNVEGHEQGEKLFRTTTGMFLPHHLTAAIVRREEDYASRTSPLLIDIVLPRFMSREAWIQLCHRQGYGVDSHLVWRSAQAFGFDESGRPPVELACGGNEMAYWHYGSDGEYRELLEGVRGDARLGSLAYAGAAVRWRRRFAGA